MQIPPEREDRAGPGGAKKWCSARLPEHPTSWRFVDQQKELFHEEVNMGSKQNVRWLALVLVLIALTLAAGTVYAT